MKDLFYICGCSDTPQGGIYLCRELAGGNIEIVSSTHLAGANYICFSPDGKYLFSTLNTARDASGGGVASYKILPDGSLDFVSSQRTKGAAACHVATSPDGCFLYCANYLTGDFAEFPLNTDGAIGHMSALVSHTRYGHGPNADRQECAHMHCVRFTPDGKYLCAVDLGTDSVYLYPFTEGKGISHDPVIFHATPGDGSRHILFDASGEFAYIINELGNSVTTCSYSSGNLCAIMTYSTLPSGCEAVTKASAIRLSGDGRYLYASNRGYDSTACYRVAGGRLEIFDIVPSNGTSPRDINFLPSGRFFCAANEFSDNVTVYSFDASNGRLSHIPERELCGIPRPLCVEY